ENVFAVRGGEIITPPQTADILDGISRKSILQIAADLGYPVVERDLARAELCMAEEVFLSGTAAELVPVREIDDHAIGNGAAGPITLELQRVFDDALHGRDPRYADWLDVVKVPTRAA
ncbi:MAG: aminotransferase class IV, partial [Solirubrobacterales bacterium]|nr:aminotransferase class IV [Solirubrobacterales bacterium]